MTDKPVNVFCFPFAGGSRYSYNLYLRHLTSAAGLIQLDYSGHGSRIKEPLLYDAASVADDMFAYIRSQLQPPYLLYGHSMGALISCLVARRIVRAGLPAPFHVLLTGCEGPSSRIAAPPKNRHLLAYDDFVEELRTIGGVPPELLDDEDSMRFFMPMIRADFEVVDTYRYTPPERPLDIPVTIITGSAEKITPNDAAKWQDETSMPLAMRQMEGGHFFILDHPARVMEELNRTVSQLVAFS